MHWAAVRTQQDAMRTPPHACVNGSDEPEALRCRDTCHGWSPGRDSLPPMILVLSAGSGLPHWENMAGQDGDITWDYGQTIRIIYYLTCYIGAAVAQEVQWPYFTLPPANRNTEGAEHQLQPVHMVRLEHPPSLGFLTCWELELWLFKAQPIGT